MKIHPTTLPEVLRIEPDVYGDARGYFYEAYQAKRYADAGLPAEWVQDNLSFSKRGTLRGLHLQNPQPQGKLVSVLVGEVLDVAVDVRVGSPRFGRAIMVPLSAHNHSQLWIPPGFAHGFCVLSEEALFAYKCSGDYDPSCEIGIAWNDPALAIEWPFAEPILSEKDRRHPRLASIDSRRLPRYLP